MAKPNRNNPPPLDLRKPNETWESRRAAGKALRDRLPREQHAEFKPAKNRPDPVELIKETNKGRQEHLIPLRMTRMALSPFTFLRGAAVTMAHDLSRTPVTGINVQMDGDAHLDNFGLYGTDDGDIVFDLNDFDETIPGPWEWDLKRLTASFNVAARANGFTRRERRVAVMECVAGYRTNLERLEGMGVLQTWTLHSHPGRENPLLEMNPQFKVVATKAVKDAGIQDNNSLLGKVARKDRRGAWTFRSEPPILTRVDQKTREQVIDGLNEYADSLYRSMRYLLSRYHVVDVAHRVVGVGSVGTRAYLVMLFGNGEHDPLFLQVKEGWPSATAPFVASCAADLTHEGKRVIVGQRALQARSDLMIGWTTVGGRPFYVRQMKNRKGAIPVEGLVRPAFNYYAWACGSVLARAHARTGDAGGISGYCGKSDALDRALADWAEAYGDQTEKDHAALVAAIKGHKLPGTVPKPPKK